jgi:hypothetical protein
MVDRCVKTVAMDRMELMVSHFKQLWKALLTRYDQSAVSLLPTAVGVAFGMAAIATAISKHDKAQIWQFLHRSSN